MIVPLASEAEWTPVWTTATSWQPPDKALLVIVPHPDDETLGIGGFIARQVAKGLPIKVQMERMHIQPKWISEPCAMQSNWQP